MSYKFPERTVEIRSYELALILSPESSDANKNLIKALEKIIKTNKDKVITKDPWGVKRMAYAIDKFRDGGWDAVEGYIGDVVDDSIGDVKTKVTLYEIYSVYGKGQQ